MSTEAGQFQFQDGWRASLEQLTAVGLLTHTQQRGRHEYALGPVALRLIEAAAEQKTLPFKRVEDLERREAHEHAKAS